MIYPHLYHHQGCLSTRTLSVCLPEPCLFMRTEERGKRGEERGKRGEGEERRGRANNLKGRNCKRGRKEMQERNRGRNMTGMGGKMEGVCGREDEDEEGQTIWEEGPKDRESERK